MSIIDCHRGRFVNIINLIVTDIFMQLPSPYVLAKEDTNRLRLFLGGPLDNGKVHEGKKNLIYEYDVL